MRYLLHTYTRLGTTSAARVADCQAVCSYSKLDLAMQILTRETAGISTDTPSFVARNMRLAPHEFGATTVGVYALDTLDVSKVFTAACSVILGCGTDLPNYSLTCAQAEAVETPASHIQYGVSAAKYRSDTNGAEVALEGRGISGYRITDKYAVLVWDFVDIDDLYPIKQETDVKRDAVGAYVHMRMLVVEMAQELTVWCEQYSGAPGAVRGRGGAHRVPHHLHEDPLAR